jgi:hypothetical protein
MFRRSVVLPLFAVCEKVAAVVTLLQISTIHNLKTNNRFVSSW